MGTRSLTHIHDGDISAKTLCTVYRQFDGYPTGLGSDIFDAIGSRQLVNGINNHNTQANGMGCAAALLIAHLKSGMGAGNTYIYPPDSDDCSEDYVYDVFSRNEALWLKCREAGEDGKELYCGPLAEFDAKAAQEKQAA